MKKSMFAFTLIVFAAWLGLAKASAYSGSPEKAAKMITGEIVSATATEVVVKDSMGTEVHLLVDNSTKITKEGKNITVGDVKVGDIIAADCEASGESLIAKPDATPPTMSIFKPDPQEAFGRA